METFMVLYCGGAETSKFGPISQFVDFRSVSKLSLNPKFNPNLTRASLKCVNIIRPVFCADQKLDLLFSGLEFGLLTVLESTR